MLKKVRELAELEEKSLQSEVSPADVKLIVSTESRKDEQGEDYEERVLSIDHSGKKRIATSRALNNTLRITGFSKKLFNELPEGQLNRDLNYQLGRFSSLGLIEEGNQVHSIFDYSRRPYSSYMPFLDSSFNHAYVKGSPIKDDYIRLQTIEAEIEDGIQIGLAASISSNGLVRSKVSYGTYRMVCSNGVTIPVLVKGSESYMDGTIFQGYVNAIRERLSDFKDFVNSSREEACKLSFDSQDPYLEVLRVPKNVKETLISCFNESEGSKDIMKAAGVDKVKNYWEAYNVLTYIANHAPGLTRAHAMENNVQSWFNQRLLAN